MDRAPEPNTSRTPPVHAAETMRCTDCHETFSTFEAPACCPYCGSQDTKPVPSDTCPDCGSKMTKHQGRYHCRACSN